MTLNDLQIEYVAKASRKITLAQNNFWEFCKLQAPDFYTDDKTYLKDYCDIIQKFHERKLLKQDGLAYRILIIEMPPRHGKTRTLVLFSAWLFGKNPRTKIISTSYNDDTATDFSRYTRDLIAEEKNTLLQIVYADIFPHTKIKYGNASMHSWAIEGQFFSYKGSGVGGTITGKGGDKIFIDDPVKNASEAFNETHLAGLWQWYTGTLLSRQEHDAQQIICHTPWAKKDIGGRLQEEQASDCYVFSRPAYNTETNAMLCPEILDLEEYKKLESTMEPLIFSANYNMKRMDVKGLLYGKDLKTYTEYPIDAKKTRKAWIDTADQGKDYLCHITADIIRDYIYVVDVYYTKSDVSVTEEEMAKRINELQPEKARYESNSGGHAIAMHVKKILNEKYKYYKTHIETVAQRANKEARILSNAQLVRDRVLFPFDWKYKWPEYYQAMVSHMKEGKNKNDDAPDTTTAMVEEVFNNKQLTAPDSSAGYLGL